MKTTQSNTWMRFLVLGVFSILNIFILNSCTKHGRSRTGYFYYVNKTQHLVEVSFNKVNLLALKPNETYKVEDIQPTEKKPKDVNAKDFLNPLSINELNIKMGAKCSIATVNSPNSIINIHSYKSEKIENSKYKFTYTFTDADYERAVACP